MSKLDELIQQYCPDGVEYKRIDSFTKVLRGKRLTKDLLSDENQYPVYHGGLEPLGFYNSANRKANTVMIINVGASAGTVGYSDIEFWSSDGCFCIDKNALIDDKYLYYYLQNKEYYFTAKVRKAGIPTLDIFIVESFEIPIPPLPVQEEIVRILDKYTELEQELEQNLEQELELRKKQYEYYRDKMLALEDFDGEVEEVSLGTVARVSRGGNFQKKDFVSDGKPCIHYGQIYTRYGLSTDTSLTSVNEEVWNKSKKAKKGNIVMAVTSENYDDVCKCVVWEGDEDAAISGHTAIIDHDIDAHYLAHYFNTSHFYKQKLKIAHGTKVIEVTPAALNDIIIKIPKDIDEQTRIAILLDGFEKLVADISEGLPAEIRMRHQQYEFYRDKLLSFKRKEM